MSAPATTATGMTRPGVQDGLRKVMRRRRKREGMRLVGIMSRKVTVSVSSPLSSGLPNCTEPGSQRPLRRSPVDAIELVIAALPVLAMLAGFVKRAAGLRAALPSGRELV